MLWPGRMPPAPARFSLSLGRRVPTNTLPGVWGVVRAYRECRLDFLLGSEIHDRGSASQSTFPSNPYPMSSFFFPSVSLTFLRLIAGNS